MFKPYFWFSLKDVRAFLKHCLFEDKNTFCKKSHHFLISNTLYKMFLSSLQGGVLGAGKIFKVLDCYFAHLSH